MAERLYSDASGQNPRSARATRQREQILSSRPEPDVKPEGYALMVNAPEMLNSSRPTARQIGYKSPSKAICSGRDGSAAGELSKKKVSERSERAFEEDENTRDESREMAAADGYIHY